ncbi:MAG: DUF1192 family protein [Alphaproteobacteria bacterium]|nr:DUF1192 family protein [Alphaproteobacteria bacterium]
MVDDDPFAPARKRDVPLDLLSIDDLEERIATLQQEIAACEKAIAAKRAQRAAADSLFSRGAQA